MGISLCAGPWMAACEFCALPWGKGESGRFLGESEHQMSGMASLPSPLAFK